MPKLAACLENGYNKTLGGFVPKGRRETGEGSLDLLGVTGSEVAEAPFIHENKMSDNRRCVYHRYNLFLF